MGIQSRISLVVTLAKRKPSIQLASAIATPPYVPNRGVGILHAVVGLVAADVSL